MLFGWYNIELARIMPSFEWIFGLSSIGALALKHLTVECLG